MITKNEITALSLSPTKKDFVQIWNELLEVAGKLSERWDPTSTNESDPGIVILKALTGIADKLNYNIDKNILEAFMPTAAQEDSMRKLCDMLGYNIKYYRSAETEVTIKYYNSDPSDDEKNVMSGDPTVGEPLAIPKFTVITNNDQDISYFTINQVPQYITSITPTITLPCMEGQIVKCESTTDNNVITATQISKENRFYLPEAHIAENGIFIYNVFGQGDALVEGTRWEKVDNLNIQSQGIRVFRFGYDSYEARPYIEFPADYSELINDGLFIYYARTSGANGNVSARTLTQLELPSGEGWRKVSAESFSVENTFAATSGANIETISQAYNNFKKTVGTFETLVTCRDYMNKIYSMLDSVGKPYVSNILVTDIRNDLNRAVTICSCGDSGIFYKETPLVVDHSTSTVKTDEDFEETIALATKPVYSTHSATKLENSLPISTSWRLGGDDGFALFDKNDIVDNSWHFDIHAPGETFEGTDGYWHIRQNDLEFTSKWPIVKSTKTIITTDVTKIVEKPVPAIDHFDLVFYPFKSYTQIKGNVRDVQEVYDSSFKCSSRNLKAITDRLDDVKTIAHNIKSPREQDIVSINNYLKLNAIIATNSKITEAEGDLLKDTIKIALANAFNMRELDFGEEIPFEHIVDVIEKADSRIKMVSLNEPVLYTTFSVLEGNDITGEHIIKEYAVASEWLTEEAADLSGRFEIQKDADGNYTNGTYNTLRAKEIYNYLAVRNVLAGRVPLFKYNNTFKNSFSEAAYRVTTQLDYDTNKKDLDAIFTEEPTAENPVIVRSYDGNTYTAQYHPPVIDEVTNEPVVNPDTGKPSESEIIYTKTYVPTEYTNNIIAKKNKDDNNITEITTHCEIAVKEDATISDLTLANGEFIKFRAPNFITKKTYPAYVNYHLKLFTPTETDAAFAEAYSLSNLLIGSQNSGKPKWADVFEYFNRELKKSFTFAQKITFVDKEDENTTKIGNNIIIKLEDAQKDTTRESAREVLQKSGCVKLKQLTAKIVDEAGKSIPDLSIGIDKNDTASQYITNAEIFTNNGGENTLPQKVNTDLGIWFADNADKVPKEGSWTISFEFEYIPFDISSLATWEAFIKTRGKTLFDFTPSTLESVFWRTVGEGYAAGKYALSDGKKLKPFTNGFFGNLDYTGLGTRLDGVYVAKSLGKDAKPNYIENAEDYKLRANEYLYIEYTPSSTTEDGATQTQASVTEIHGPGTIIRPTGFEEGLKDSSTNAGTAHKKVAFAQVGEVDMYSLGASEQIEIRDFARVTLDSETFQNSEQVYVYKNFTNCPELEGEPKFSGGKRIGATYTLKDGEYVFYTDSSMSEYAYFTSGTDVTLTGRVTIPASTIIDIATILESGPQVIPWYSTALVSDDSIIFQEYQYTTLGSGDTIKNITLLEAQDKLTEQWQLCDDVVYIPSGDETPVPLDKINIKDEDGNGWKVCSMLELDVSSSSAQTLRNIKDTIKTSITLDKTNSRGAVIEGESILIEPQEGYPLSFKTNLACQSSNGKLKLSDVYVNPNKLKSFEVKVFSDSAPSVIKTVPGTVTPYSKGPVKPYLDITAKVPGGTVSKSTSGAWWQVPFTKITRADEDAEDTQNYENSLKLSVSLLPSTYGIFSIYLDYKVDYDKDTTADNTEFKTWLEVTPGTGKSIALLNAKDNWVSEENRLYLNPGLNCIQVMATGDIFLKATKEAAGAIYFDELQLVNTAYTKDTQGELKTLYGLNLDQIGYLDAIPENSGTFNVFDGRVRQKRKEVATVEALTALDERVDEENTNINTIKEELKAVNHVQKLETFVKFLTQVKSERDALSTADEDIFIKYKNVYTDLKNEKALKEALENNKDFDALDKQLVDLLNTFADTDTAREALFTELEGLIEAAETTAEKLDAENLRKGDILDDFQATANTVTYPYLVEDIKFASRRNVYARYGEQLDKLAIDVESVLTSNDAINAALDVVSATKHQAILTLINELINTYEDSLNTSVAAIQTTARGTIIEGNNVVDNVLLESALLELRDRVSAAGVRLLINKIEAAAEIGAYQEVIETVDALKLLLEEASGSDNTIIADIDYLLGKVRAGDRIDTDTKLTGLSDKIDDYYNDKLTAILTKISEKADSLGDDITKARATLDSLSDAQIAIILNRLTVLSTTNAAYETIINSFGTGSDFNIQLDYTSMPFGEEAVLESWPVYMKQSLLSGVNQLYKDIRRVAKGVDIKFAPSYHFYTAGVGSDLRSVIAQAANLDAFSAMFDTARDLGNKTNQGNSRRQLIEDLSDLIPKSEVLSTAMQVFENSTDNDTAIINSLVKQLRDPATTTLVEKQQILNELKVALDNAIYTDAQLVEVSAKLLCPTILVFDKTLENANDEFYSKLRKLILDEAEVISQAKGLTSYLNSEGSRTFASNIATAQDITSKLLESIINDKLSEFNSWNLISTTYLSDSYENKLKSLKNSLDVKNWVAEIKKSALFSILQKEDLNAAWQDKDGNWMDSFGRYFKQTPSNNDLWQNSEGKYVKVYVKREYGRDWAYNDNQTIAIGIEVFNDAVVDIESGRFTITKTMPADMIEVRDKNLWNILNELLQAVTPLGETVIPADYSETYKIDQVEEQLLAAIRDIDKNRDFYYNVPIESHVAIDFNEGESKLNTLMNPAINYDINNVNNNFVISKLDIDYLTKGKGLQIARSSRLN